MFNHPLWKVDVGWVCADLLKNDDEILLNNGRKVKIFGGSPVLRTKNSKIGWVASSLEAVGEMNATSNGYLINFLNYDIVTPFDDYEQWANGDVDYWAYAAEDLIGERFSYWAYCDTVYNLEVENFHTYFVEERGIWVHQ